MKKVFLLVILCLSCLSVAMLDAQVSRQSGVIKGIVTDNQGSPVRGIEVTARSPALMGVVSALTYSDGTYRLVNLPPGTYTVTVAQEGYKTVKRENIVVAVGQTYTVNLVTETSTVQEEVTVVGTPPVVDVQSSKVGGVLTTELLKNLPIARNMVSIFTTVPGAAGTIDTYSGSVHGGAWGSVAYEIDGVGNNDPTHNGLLVKPQYDSMEEIEIATGGLPAQVGNTGGTLVNIVTKSGGNTFHGQVQGYYTNDTLTRSLFPKEEMKAMGFSSPTLPKYDIDASASLGGPIIKDKLWFFSTLQYLGQKNILSFIPTTVTFPKTVSYEGYNNPRTEIPFFLKLTTQFSKSMRFFAMINGSVMNQDVYATWDAKRAYDSQFTLKNNTWIAATGELNWMFGANTYANFRAGYVNRDYPITAKNPQNAGYYDDYTGYTYNGILDNQSFIVRRSNQASARLVHYKDNFLGGNHELGAGIEWLYNFDRYGYARGNPLTMIVFNGDPYVQWIWNGLSDTSPDFGDGYISFSTTGPNKNDAIKELPDTRISAYLQDSFTIKNRLTFNIGVRLDYWNGKFGGGTSKGVSGIPYEIGQQIKEEIGFNPYASYTVPAYTNLIKFTGISPRFGFSYDVFGNGKTALKGSWNRYQEAVPVMWYSIAQPSIGDAISYYWFDTNRNKTPDSPGIDKYLVEGGASTIRLPNEAALRNMLDPNLHSPYYYEWTLSLSHELLKNFVVKAQYLNKRQHDRWADWRLYDPDTDTYWYSLKDAPAGWWVPYTTTVPAYGEFPAKEVTFYAMSKLAPYDNQHYRTHNSMSAKIKYDCAELTFDKRYANGWALGGSIVLAKNIDYWPGHPNDERFSDSLSAVDIPLAVKVYGTFNLPGDFNASFFYRHESGTPYSRTISVILPASFVAANNLYDTRVSGAIEPNGTHRGPAYDNIDLRFEKEFKVKFGTFGVFLDVFNLFGNKYVDIGRNPGGIYNPDAGTYTSISSSYGKVTNLRGVRTFKFSARVTF